MSHYHQHKKHYGNVIMEQKVPVIFVNLVLSSLSCMYRTTVCVVQFTLSSLRLVSASYALPVSALPRREEVPPSDARVAAERPGVAQREDGCKRTVPKNPGQKTTQTNTTQLRHVVQRHRLTLQMIVSYSNPVEASLSRFNTLDKLAHSLYRLRYKSHDALLFTCCCSYTLCYQLIYRSM